MGNNHLISMKVGTQVDKSMLSLKIINAEALTIFHDGPSCYLGNSSACYEMVNNRPISMKIGAQTKTVMLSSKITIAEVTDPFQDGRRRHLEMQLNAIKWAITTPL
jgi:hypothetical protein